jgi:hypothetical protein
VPARRPVALIVARSAAFTLLAVVAAALAGCSKAPESGRARVAPSALLSQAAAAVGKVSFVHVAGRVTSTKGKDTDLIDVNATSNQSGDSSGSLEFEGPGMGFEGKTQFIVNANETYVLGGTSLWKSFFGAADDTPEAQALLPEVANHWIELPPTSTKIIEDDAVGLTVPAEWLEKSLKLTGSLTNAGDGAVSGQSGVEVSSSQGANVLVARSGAPLPLALSAETSKSGDTVDFSLVTSYPTSASLAAPKRFESLTALEAAFSGP